MKKLDTKKKLIAFVVVAILVTSIYLLVREMRHKYNCYFCPDNTELTEAEETLYRPLVSTGVRYCITGPGDTYLCQFVVENREPSIAIQELKLEAIIVYNGPHGDLELQQMVDSALVIPAGGLGTILLPSYHAKSFIKRFRYKLTGITSDGRRFATRDEFNWRLRPVPGSP